MSQSVNRMGVRYPSITKTRCGCEDVVAALHYNNAITTKSPFIAFVVPVD